ncbi:DUF58 domain-containing protein [Congregibacter litoralis]|uniref:Putative conserved protein domain protein n=1 Tax=Congregibacter litoralis KT71 TaxID=314285 RepID=A4A853_9GAMM|nr:DUF58 domain-containing protein [Congregibacter litoralis]EAQ97848.2 putative conserved protein domain protein [Congregibacter litoralis KT71]
MTSTWSERLSQRWTRWLDRRIPRSRSVTLSQRQIFIFPSRTGFFFALCLLVMLIAAINYQNNMSYALTFLLANLFVVAVLHTYANLSGLTITAVGADDAYAGQRSGFHLRFSSSNKRGHHALLVGWPEAREARRRRRLFTGLLSSPAMIAVEEIDVEPGASRDLVLHIPVGKRGWYRPGRLRIESSYPLGLLRCWTWVDLDQRALVYPAPMAAAEPEGAAGDSLDGRWLSGKGDDEFFGIRDYRAGDNPRRVYWKGLARGQALQTKDYASAVADARWLDWEQFSGLDQERRLSALCHWVMDYHRREFEFGLRIPGMELAPASGDRQRDQALRALALFGVNDAEPGT